MTAILDGAGNNVSNRSYDAFGNVTSTSGDYQSSIGFTGREVDGTGLVYLRNRYYDPGVGRFTSEDPVKSGDNWFGYCGGNPICYIDQFGLETTIYIHSGENLYGHVAINVNGTVYSFGRYRGRWGPSDFSGEGILFIVPEDNYFNDPYFGAGTSNIQEWKLDLTPDQEQDIGKFFGALANGGKPVMIKGRRAYKLKKDYDVITNNCTTLVLGSLPQNIRDQIGPCFSPYSLNEGLDTMVSPNPFGYPSPDWLKKGPFHKRQ